MPYPLHHDDLISPGNIREAQGLSLMMSDQMDDEDPLAAMTAAAVLLVAVCKLYGEDPQDVLEQILDTVELGAAKQKGLN